MFRNAHWILERDDQRHLFFARRTAQPQLTAAEIEASFRQLEAAMDTQGRHLKSLLIDFSQGPAPARRDPEFESAVDKHAQDFARGFLKVAALTLTVAGRVQVEQYFRDRGFIVGVFSNEAEAVSYLSSKDAPRR